MTYTLMMQKKAPQTPLHLRPTPETPMEVVVDNLPPSPEYEITQEPEFATTTQTIKSESSETVVTADSTAPPAEAIFNSAGGDSAQASDNPVDKV